jgi:hypothetical protein
MKIPSVYSLIKEHHNRNDNIIINILKSCDRLVFCLDDKGSCLEEKHQR